MVSDLNMPIEIIGVETVREESGLAKSSRNGYLTATEKSLAPALNQALLLIKQSVLDGIARIDTLKKLATEFLNEAGLKTDYILVRDAHTLAPLTKETTEIVILGAAYLGKARLIDNISFKRETN
jgi:pantoate--beta-alanine ligase